MKSINTIEKTTTTMKLLSSSFGSVRFHFTTLGEFKHRKKVLGKQNNSATLKHHP
jgi:hypothetical protein